ncbi:MAG: response regulator transcription factor [Proteobacteria bacterium]|nr:response regulator transcription factor [Pseudomonadota bacterium]
MKTRLVLVDDHAVLRDALQQMLSAEPDIDVVGQAGNGREAIVLARELRPDIMILDVGMPDYNGIEATAAILARFPEIKIIALSTHSDRRFVSEMICAGASGYVVKTAAGSELLRAIRAVALGRSFLSPEVATGVMRALANQHESRGAPSAELTRREREVLRLLSEGLRSVGIARRLNVAASTVDVHRRNLMRKLTVHTVAELTRYALREGLTEL